MMIVRLGRGLRIALRSFLLFIPLVLWGLRRAGRLEHPGLLYGLGALGVALFVHQCRGRFRWLMFTVLVGILVLLLFWRPQRIVRLYPFLMSLHVTLLFFGSSADESSMLERLISPFKTLGYQERSALRRANTLWQYGLLGNTVVLGGLLVGFSLESWALYAGFWSYLWLATLVLMTVIYVHLSKKFSRKSQSSMAEL